MRVPFLDVSAAHEELAHDIEDAVMRVLRLGTYVGGSEVEAFEAEWSAFVGSLHCVGVGNGLDALTLALRAVGVGRGDEVIVPAHTFIATWLSVTAVGAVPIPVDPAPGQYLIDASAVSSAVTERTRAVIPVHLYGDPVNLDPIIEVSRRHNLAVVEDAAQAHGAESLGRRVGSIGDVGAWSFYPGKNLGAVGDAGAITTDNPEIASTVRRLANYGSADKFVHLERGVNSRLDPVQAAVLRTKLPHLTRWNERRARLASIYRQSLPSGICLPLQAEEDSSAHHLFVVTVDERDAVRLRLSADGIETGLHYPIPPHLQGAYSSLAERRRWSLPVSESLAARVLSLPIGPHLSESDVARVADALHSAL